MVGADEYSVHSTIVKLQLFCQKKEEPMILREASLWGNPGSSYMAELTGRQMESLQPKLISLMVEIFINLMIAWDFCSLCRSRRQFKHFLSLQDRDCSVSGSIQKL